MGRIRQLDGLRAVAIGAVFLHHALHVRALWMGVDLFFILSGFLITGILSRGKTDPIGSYFKRFYLKRARRILPPYLILLVLLVVLYGARWLRHGYMYLFLMNFLLPLNIPAPPPAGVLWSLAVEEQFYLFWPFAVFFLPERWLLRLSVGLVLCVPLLRWLCTPYVNVWCIYMLTPFRMDLLAAGAVLSILWRRHPEWIRRYGHLGLLGTVAGMGALWVMAHFLGYKTYSNQPGSNVWIYEASLVACTGLLLWALSGRMVDVLTLAPVVYLGTISYTVYLIHTLMLARLPWVWAAVATVVYASISWFVLERPLTRGPGHNLGRPERAV